MKGFSEPGSEFFEGLRFFEVLSVSFFCRFFGKMIRCMCIISSFLDPIRVNLTVKRAVSDPDIDFSRHSRKSRCVDALPQGYHSSNPYHNGVHAADVTQAINCFLREPALRRHLRPVETMAALLAAVCHDLDHPGKNLRRIRHFRLETFSRIE